ncbi:MAG: hypothetical protein H7A25_15280 [Leptospiraceae bacterium]|nr:hypothetical protein [Leptospiraceae bacterium]MCP5501261.1 hypothetical protein [Leptospiraceae bacterium]
MEQLLHRRLILWMIFFSIFSVVSIHFYRTQYLKKFESSVGDSPETFPLRADSSSKKGNLAVHFPPNLEAELLLNFEIAESLPNVSLKFISDGPKELLSDVSLAMGKAKYEKIIPRTEGSSLYFIHHLGMIPEKDKVYFLGHLKEDPEDHFFYFYREYDGLILYRTAPFKKKLQIKRIIQHVY